MSQPAEPRPALECSLLGLLAVQAVGVGIWLAASGRLTPELVNDSPSYVEFPWTSAEAILNQHRTPGYPAFLQISRLFGSNFESTPLLHFVVYASAVAMLYLGVKRVTHVPKVAFIAASTLLYSRILHGYVNTIATDTLASALGIATCGLTLWRLSSERNRALTIGLMVVVTLGWLVRPAYLFLVPLVPLVTWQTRSYFNRPDRRDSLLLFAGLLLPLLAYCLLRLAVVDRFGIVSFGGYNQIGIAGQFLVDEDVERLPDELRPLAQAVLQARESGTLPGGKYDELPRMNYMRMEDRYDIAIWSEFAPAAERLCGDDKARINTLLRKMAGALIRLHPEDYAAWLAKATRQAAKKVLWDFADNPVTLLMLLAAVAAICVPSSANAESADLDVQCPARWLLTISATYLTLNLMLVIPVCPPLGRMTDGASVLLACPLAVWLWSRISSCSPWRTQPASVVAANRGAI